MDPEYYGGGHYQPKVREKRKTINDSDRSQWIDNDEGLYSWWRSSRQSKRAFIRENRAEITRIINDALNRSPRS